MQTRLRYKLHICLVQCDFLRSLGRNQDGLSVCLGVVKDLRSSYEVLVWISRRLFRSKEGRGTVQMGR